MAHDAPELTPEWLHFGLAESHDSGQGQRRRGEKFARARRVLQAPAEADFHALAFKQRAWLPLGVANQALGEDLRIRDLKVVCIADTIRHHLNLVGRGTSRAVAELEGITRDRVVPGAQRAFHGARQPCQLLKDVGLARRVRSVDSRDRQYLLVEQVKASCRGPVLVYRDHRQLDRIKDRAVVGYLEPQ